MINLSHRSMVLFSGILWLAIGCWLLPLGLNFILDGELGDAEKISLITSALLIGYFKGKKVLGKSAQKGIQRILSLPDPAPMTSIYKPSYYLLFAAMIGMGMLAKYLPLAARGFVDTVVGAALINGAMVYFKAALSTKFAS